MGRAKTDFQSDNFKEGINVHYEESAPVYAGHARLGKVIKLNEKGNIDVYGSYSFSHQDRVNINLSTNENYNVGSINSNRLRAGCRITKKLNNGKLYYGLAYQYEANAKIKSRQNGNDVDMSSAKGNSGIMELGYKISADKNKTASIDINTTGFAGRQKGFVIQAQFTKMI